MIVQYLDSPTSIALKTAWFQSGLKQTNKQKNRKP